jgi:glyoxylase-like metal-dependent hydrolase (beta-lactamase superfamily II)
LRKTFTGKTEPEIRKMLVDDYGIHKISIVSKMFGFVVNSFFVEKPCPTLVDVPPDHKIYLEKLQIGLKAIGYSLADIKRIITTHPHFDHFGAAQTISELSGAEVWTAHEGAYWFEHFKREIHDEEIARAEFLLEAGANYHDVQAVDKYYRPATPLARSVRLAKHLGESDLVELSTLVFTVAKVPGHTPWCILLHDTENRIGFSGDCLQTIISNPLIQRNVKTLQSYNSMKSYIASLKKIDTMGLQIALPGHGEIIENGSKKARQLLGIIQQRRIAVIDSLKEGEQTPVKISRKLFPLLLPGRLFNAVSEISAHLEMLETEGLVHKVGKHPVCYSAS